MDNIEFFFSHNVGDALKKEQHVFKKQEKDCVCVCLPVNESSATTQSQRFKKKLAAFESFCMNLNTYHCHHYAQQCLCQWPQFLGAVMNRAVRAARNPWWDFFERSLIYTIPIYPREALCGDEERYKMTSARDGPGEL